jgi:hypothetical protein
MAPEKLRIRLDPSRGQGTVRRIENSTDGSLWQRAQELVRHPECRGRFLDCSHDDPLPNNTFRVSGHSRIASIVAQQGQWAALISRSGTASPSGPPLGTFDLGLRLQMSYYVQVFQIQGGRPIASA